jgi:hypothetical protein
MKNKLIAYLIGAIVVLAGLLFLSMRKAVKMENNWKTAMANVKAYSDALSSSKESNTALQLTMAQVKSYNDSILQALEKTRKELKLKEKNVQSMQYIKTYITKTDTLCLKDTIFKESKFALDTLIGDEWCSVKLGLKYPSQISVNPKFKSEKHTFTSLRKETVNPPKKFFLARWLQKKHKVLTVISKELNPYVENQETRHVEIIK